MTLRLGHRHWQRPPVPQSTPLPCRLHCPTPTTSGHRAQLHVLSPKRYSAHFRHYPTARRRRPCVCRQQQSRWRDSMKRHRHWHPSQPGDDATAMTTRRRCHAGCACRTPTRAWICPVMFCWTQMAIAAMAVTHAAGGALKGKPPRQVTLACALSRMPPHCTNGEYSTHTQVHK